MNLTTPQAAILPAMSSDGIDKVQRLQARLLLHKQPDLATHHTLHAGLYTRTVKLSAGQVVTGALIKVATTLTVCGDVTVFIGDQAVKLTGYNVIPASAGRKQAFIAHSDTWLTMAFVTDASTVEQAEDEFTDEAHLLLSRQQVNQDVAIITGE